MTQVAWFVCLFVVAMGYITPEVVAELGDIPPDHWSLSPKYRLPKALVPTHYDLRIVPILDTPVVGHTNFTAPGQVKINVDCVEETYNVTLHASSIVSIDANSVVILDLETNEEIPATGFETNDILDFLIIHLGRSLQAGRAYSIQINFVAPVSTNLLNGLYLSKYTKPASNETSYAAATQFQMFSFRQMCPGFDEPGLKATFNISIGHWPTKYHALCNTDVESTSPVELPGFEGWIWKQYRRTVVMPPYLIAIVVSDFDYTEAQPSLYPKPVRVYGVPHQIANGDGLYAADTAAVQLKYMEEFFGIESVMPKTDIAAVPDFLYGAMENWGLITFTPSLLYFTPNISTHQEKAAVTHTIAHELGHYFFGNLVTCVWWNDIWVQEGGTTYASVYLWQHSQPEFEPLKWFQVDAFQNSLRTEELGTSVGKEFQNNGSQKIVDNFNDVTARKGAILMRMMHMFLGPETVQRGITRYLRGLEYSAGTQADFFRYITEQALEDGRQLPEGVGTVNEIMYTYTYNRGLPILYVYNVTGEETVVHIRQAHYRGIDSTQEDSSGWWIPVTVATQEQPDFETSTPQLWMRPLQTEATLPVADLTKWIIVNPSGRGYYRVIYNAHLTHLIQNQLEADHTVISPESRSQLIDDYFMAAFQNGTDYTDIETALSLTKYLGRESDRIVWETLIINLRSAFGLSFGTPALPEFKRYFLPKFLSALNLTGFGQAPQPTGAKGIMVTLLMDWICRMDTPECNELTRTLMDEWKLDPENYIISPDVQASIYCNGIATGTPADIDFLFGHYAVATNVGQKGRLLSALACSRDLSVLTSLLEEAIAINSRFTEADRITVIQRVATNYLARTLTLNFINSNLTAVLERLGNAGLTRIVNTLSVNMAREQELTAVSGFINDNEPALDSSTTATLRSYLPNIQKNINWRNAYEGRIAYWMNKNWQ